MDVDGASGDGLTAESLDGLKPAFTKDGSTHAGKSKYMASHTPLSWPSLRWYCRYLIFSPPHRVPPQLPQVRCHCLQWCAPTDHAPHMPSFMCSRKLGSPTVPFYYRLTSTREFGLLIPTRSYHRELEVRLGMSYPVHRDIDRCATHYTTLTHTCTVLRCF